MKPGTLTIAAATLMTAACSGGANLSVSARGGASTLTAATTAAPAGDSLDLGNGISLSRARVVIRKLKLELPHESSDGGSRSSRSSSSSSSTDVSTGGGSRRSHDAGPDGLTEMERGHDDEHEVVVGPLLADLSAATLRGDLKEVFAAMVPEGTFRELKFVIGHVDPERAGSNPVLADMASQHASVILDGTVDGAPFTFVSSLCAEIEIETEVVVSAGAANNITLAVDPKSWFTGSAGERLDPRDEATKSAIERNIKQSIHGFEDHHRSGHGRSGSADGGSGDRG
jgi:hypothetical protein